MLSRRKLLAGGGLALAGTGGAFALERPIPIDGSGGLDWPMARYDPAGTGHNPEASGPKDGVQVQWETIPENSVSGPASPVALGDTLFVTSDEALVALDRETGTTRFERSGHSYLSGPTRADASAYATDTLIVGGIAGLHGLSAGGGYALGGTSLGLERWHAPGQKPTVRRSGGTRFPKHVAAQGTVYGVVPERDRILALDANSGRLDWAYSLEEWYVVNRPAVRDGTVYVSGRPNQMVALDTETGEVSWQTTVEPEDPDYSTDARRLRAPTATSEGVVVPSRQAVTLLDADDGSLVWEFAHDGDLESGVAVADGSVFLPVGDDVDELSALALETGELVWSTPYRRRGRPVVADGVVYLSDVWNNSLFAFDAGTGEQRFSYEVGFSPSQPIVGEDTIYQVTNDRVVALSEGENG